MIHDILDWQGVKIGQVELDNSLSQEEIAKILSSYRVQPEDPVDSVLKTTIKERIDFSTDLIERFKKRNIKDGINALQGLWMHHRMRALDVKFMGMDYVIDVMNLVISGDVELATLALIYSTDDDMTQPYHWMSRERKEWLITELKNYLGWK